MLIHGEFYSLWKGWSKQPINVREQQDAGEFLTFFLGQFPSSCQKLFQDEFVHIITGINCIYTASHPELFSLLALDIPSFSTLEESFMSFLQVENFMRKNQIQTE